MNLKELANGAKLPNWVKMAAMFGVIGFQGAALWYGQREVVGRVVHGQEMLAAEFRHSALMDSIRIEQFEREIVAVAENQGRAVRQGNQIHRELWRAVNAPDRYRAIDQ